MVNAVVTVVTVVGLATIIIIFVETDDTTKIAIVVVD